MRRSARRWAGEEALTDLDERVLGHGAVAELHVVVGRDDAEHLVALGKVGGPRAGDDAGQVVLDDVGQLAQGASEQGEVSDGEGGETVGAAQAAR